MDMDTTALKYPDLHEKIRLQVVNSWRLRYSEQRWSIAMKKILRTDHASRNLLAENLLEQALIGATPNSIVISYLKHSLCTQMVDYATVLFCIIKKSEFSKPYCIISLLDFMEEFISYISECGVKEDSLLLAESVHDTVLWLLNMLNKSLQVNTDNRLAAEYTKLADSSVRVLDKLFSNQSNVALLHIASHHKPALQDLIESTSASLVRSVSQLSEQSAILDASLKSRVLLSLNNLKKITERPQIQKSCIDISLQPINLSFNLLLTMEAVLNPTSPIQPLVDQILVIELVQGLNRPQLFCEMMRTCFLGLVDAAGTTDELKWTAFTFLKLPQVMANICHSSENGRFKDLEAGIQQLISFTALLDLVDTKCYCDCLSCLLSELCSKYGLLSEEFLTDIKNQKKVNSQKIASPPPGSTQPAALLILRAEPTVATILSTLDADYSQNLEVLLGVLCRMMSGKSFELILSAAAATGRLQDFANKLIRFNEFAQQCSGTETYEASQIRAQLFDITFLMLCHICQLHSSQMMSSSQDSNRSFFTQWAVNCLPESNKYKCLDLFVPPDPVKVNALITSFQPNGDLQTISARWNDVCNNVTYAAKEILMAFEFGALTEENAQEVVNRMKSPMCCVPVVISAYLCSYVSTLDQVYWNKPLEFIRQLCEPLAQEQSNNSNFYNERSHLMQTILQKMTSELLNSDTKSTSLTPGVSCGTPPSTVPTNTTSTNSPEYTLAPTGVSRQALADTIRPVLANGIIDLKSVHCFENLFYIGGCQWFCDSLIKELLSHDRLEDLNRASCLVLALFHLDLERMCVSLLSHTVPALLQSSAARLVQLSDPRGRTLARLCITAISMTTRLRESSADSSLPKINGARKRARPLSEYAGNELEEFSHPIKIRRIPSKEDVLNFGLNFNTADKDENSSAPNVKDPFEQALANLLYLFTLIENESCFNQRIAFIMSFLRETLSVGGETAKIILKFMPIDMILKLMKCLPNEFNAQIILALSDLSTLKTRKMASILICQNSKLKKK